MYAHQRRIDAAQVALDQRDMHGAIDVIVVAVQHEIAVRRLHDLLADALDVAFDVAFGIETIANQIGDRAYLDIVLLGEALQVRAARHAAVLFENLDDRCGRLQPGKAGQIAAGLGMPGAGQHTARLRHDRKDMARAGCRCSGRAPGATAAWIVRARSCAEMPVVMPSAASIEIVKLVP